MRDSWGGYDISAMVSDPPVQQRRVNTNSGCHGARPLGVQVCLSIKLLLPWCLSVVLGAHPLGVCATHTCSLLAQSLGFDDAGDGVYTKGVPSPLPPAFGEELAQYQNARSATFEGWFGANGRMLVTTKFGNTAQVGSFNRSGCLSHVVSPTAAGTTANPTVIPLHLLVSRFRILIFDTIGFCHAAVGTPKRCRCMWSRRPGAAVPSSPSSTARSTSPRPSRATPPASST